MGGGNAFLRFSSSVAAGALILTQVALAQECVKTYEGCGSCDNPELRFLTVVSSSENLTTTKYTNCGSEPFSNAVTLGDIKGDIDGLLGTLDDCVNTNDVSVVSFPCVTGSSSFRVTFDDGGLNPDDPKIFPSLEKIRFDNLVTVGEIRIFFLPALISISAPLLEEATEEGVLIVGNENLKKISLPQLRNSVSFFVFGNAKLKKLCASELENGGTVCIGNDQPFLDADLSKLVTGSLSGLTTCDNSDAPTVCGNATDGLFSTTRCPSNACL